VRQCKYLNNMIEQDHRTVKRRVWLAMGYGSFRSAWRTLRGIEAVSMIRKEEQGGWLRQTREGKRGSFTGYSELLPED
jgi:transposase-like protein